MFSFVKLDVPIAATNYPGTKLTTVASPPSSGTGNNGVNKGAAGGGTYGAAAGGNGAPGVAFIRFKV